MFDLTPVKAAVKPTTWLRAKRLDDDHRVGMPVIIATETFQETGSFKYRAAYCAAYHSKHSHLLTASSGNFGQALALAARNLGKKCTVVMPATSAHVKIAAVRNFGAEVVLIDTRTVSRKAKVDQLAATIEDVDVLSAYDDERVIAGNSTLGEEIAELYHLEHFDCVIAPMGGGGLTAGILQGMRRKGCMLPLYAAEPALANDGARSLAAGLIIANDDEPATIADGARTISLGQHNFAILKGGLAGVIEVEEAQIEEALRMLYQLANLKVEPTGALALGALLQKQDIGKKPLLVVSGGNVDAAVYARLISFSE